MKQAIDSHIVGTRVRTNGIALHCIEAGPKDGPLVVLLHGFPEFWWGWRYQIEPLARAGFHVLVPDQRGYNLSDKPEGRRSYELDTLAQDIIGLIAALGYDTCSLVGHDWGGIAAWWTATRHPERIERMVAINAPHPAIAGPYLRRHPSQMLKSSYIGFFQLPYVPEHLLSRKRYRALRHSLQRTSRKDTFTDRDLAEYVNAWAQPGALTSMLNWYRALPLRPSQGMDIKLTMPVLAIWGMRDPFLELGLCERSLALCSRSQVVRFDRATHWVHLEEAESVCEELIGFLK